MPRSSSPPDIVKATAPIRCRFPVTGICGAQCSKPAIALVTVDSYGHYLDVTENAERSEFYQREVFLRFACQRHVEGAAKAKARIVKDFSFEFIADESTS